MDDQNHLIQNDSLESQYSTFVLDKEEKAGGEISD
jgi:hypothetical protein